MESVPWRQKLYNCMCTYIHIVCTMGSGDSKSFAVQFWCKKSFGDYLNMTHYIYSMAPRAGEGHFNLNDMLIRYKAHYGGAF